VGDTYQYTQTTALSSGINQTSTYTNQVGFVGSDGGYIVNQFDASGNFLNATAFTAANAITAAPLGNASNTGGTFSPALQQFTYPWSVGQTYSTTTALSGMSGPGPNGPLQLSRLTYNGQIQSYESVSTPAGTFNTLKATTSITNTLANTSVTQTCWMDVVTGVYVKCQVPVSGASPGTITILLNQISHQANASFVLTGTFPATGMASYSTAPANLNQIYLTPGEQNANGYLENQSGTIALTSSQQVTWTITVNGQNTSIPTGSSAQTLNTVPMTFSATATALNWNTTMPSSSTASPFTATVTAHLASDPSKTASVSVQIFPQTMAITL